MGTVNDSSSAFRRPDNKDIPALGARQTDVPSLNAEKMYGGAMDRASCQ